MKIKVNPKKLLSIILVLLLISLSVYYYLETRPIKVIYYRGYKFEFRDDIKATDKIFVHPNEESIHDMFWNPWIRNITILFKESNSTETNAYYTAEVFELTYKLTIMYRAHNMKKNFDAVPIESYKITPPSPYVLRIVLVPPEFTNATRVLSGENEVQIYGKDKRGFDLATIKTILMALDYKPKSFSQSLIEQLQVSG